MFDTPPKDIKDATAMLKELIDAAKVLKRLHASCDASILVDANQVIAALDKRHGSDWHLKP